jgi:hypothetical protein
MGDALRTRQAQGRERSFVPRRNAGADARPHGSDPWQARCARACFAGSGSTGMRESRSSARAAERQRSVEASWESGDRIECFQRSERTQSGTFSTQFPKSPAVLGLRPFLQRRVHSFEAASRFLEGAAQEGYENPSELLALDKERPAVSRLKFEVMFAVEDARQPQPPEPGKFPVRFRLENGRLEGHGSSLRWLHPDFELRASGKVAADASNERVPVGKGAEIGEHGPHALGRRVDLDFRP